VTLRQVHRLPRQPCLARACRRYMRPHYFKCGWRPQHSSQRPNHSDTRRLLRKLLEPPADVYRLVSESQKRVW